MGLLIEMVKTRERFKSTTLLTKFHAKIEFVDGGNDDVTLEVPGEDDGGRYWGPSCLRELSDACLRVAILLEADNA